MYTPGSAAVAPPAISATYPGDARQVREVRAGLLGLLNGHRLAGDAVLCASELAANAVRHTYSGMPGGRFTVRAELSLDGSVRVEVEDDGGPWAPAISDRRSPRHGLDLIHALAADWSIDGDFRTRTIWVRLDGSPPRYAAIPDGIGCPPGGDPVMPDASPTYAIASAKHIRGAHRWTPILDGPPLRQLRQLHGLTQDKLADEAGISLATVGRLERQPSAPCRCRTLVLLAHALSEHPAAITRGITQPSH